MEFINSFGGWIDNLFPLALKAMKRGKAREARDDQGINEYSPKFFTRGYGDIEFLVESEAKFRSIIIGGTKPPTVGKITILEKIECQSLLAGSFISEKWQFESPMSQYLPEESRQVICEFIKPMGNNFRAVAIVFPATGDKFFATRRNLISLWLLRHKIASLIIMAPCYGIRKPKGQKGHYNDTVSLYYRSTAALLVEGAVLANHVRESMKVPVVLAGLSFGGAMASGVGLMLDGPIGVVSSVGCPSAKVLATGLLSPQELHLRPLLRGFGQQS